MAPIRNGQRRRKEQEAGFRELLLGIPDEITLDLIVPKLAWGEFHKSLSSVSHAWLKAVRSHRIHDARVPGQKPWQKCASMITPREFCGCIVFQGKIYVFGGTSERMPVDSSEVYDPEADTWTEISPMAVWRFCHRVGIMGEELVASGGIYYTRDFLDSRTSFIQEYISPKGLAVFRDGAEAYNPMTDSWRSLPTDDGLFWVEGVLGSFTCQTLEL
ncbi:unnamed protein product [Calypogeia fissa]